MKTVKNNGEPFACCTTNKFLTRKLEIKVLYRIAKSHGKLTDRKQKIFSSKLSALCSV